MFLCELRKKFQRSESEFNNSTNSCSLLCLADSELEELEAAPRYRPESVRSLCRVTRFSEEEIKRLYRGFKAECPTGMVREETFKHIYSQFFPNGGKFAWRVDWLCFYTLWGVLLFLLLLFFYLYSLNHHQRHDNYKFALNRVLFARISHPFVRWEFEWWKLKQGCHRSPQKSSLLMKE